MRSGTALTKKDVIVMLCCAVFLLVNIGSVGRAGRERAMREICLANLRQLTLAWTQYADDNGDKLCNASAGFTRQKGMYVGPGTPGTPLVGDEIAWVGYTMNWQTIEYIMSAAEWEQHEIAQIDYTKERDTATGTYTGNTNPLDNWVLWKYVNNLKIYKCPAGRPEEYRNYDIVDAMNGASAYASAGGITLAPLFKRRSQIENGAERFVFVDEGMISPDSFTVPWTTQDAAQWWDVPTNRHSNGTTVSFADGHAEYRKWVDKRTIGLTNDYENGRTQGNGADPGNFVTTNPYNKDFEWLENGACGGWKTEN